MKNKTSRLIGTLAALSGAAGVVLLSLAAHKADSETAARILHSGGLILLLHALAAIVALGRKCIKASGLFLLGAWLFAAAMTLLIFAPYIHIAIMAPLGGIGLVLGWIQFAWHESRT